MDVEITTIAAWKGGVGKTTLAYELAYLLDAVLVDFDWDAGGASKAWGYRHEVRQKAPLLDALESGRTPTPLSGGPRKPDLLPSHPDFAVNQPEPEELGEHLSRWAAEWGRPVVADTHPGGGDATYGAMSVSRCVVVPSVLATKELSALEGMLQEVPDYPLLLVPNMVRAPKAKHRRKFSELATEAQVPVATPIPWCTWIPDRQLRIAITSEPVPKRAADYADKVRAVADAVRQYS
ncbi:ParA family protein [Actinomadura mexicana]|uniref:Chromosome partitioning protein n=1 Tax=Actinomadura mexicana TaxID=134959 RepID=A0A239HG23_9ACTN|nr:ParA family protein [Actinomadura mexicana]SNS80376.1 chromosome partitioning protein [Actinomadura mexicana]